MKHTTTFAMIVGAGIAIIGLAGCTPATHVTETTTRQYDTSTPPMMAPLANDNTTTTTRYDNGTVQRTYLQPAPYAPSDQSTTTVTTGPNGGTVQKQTTTTYSAPY